MADVQVNITLNRPMVKKFPVAGRTLADVKRNLDAREEWGLYDATQNFSSNARVDAAGNVLGVTMVLNPVIQLPSWTGYGAATRQQKTSWDAMVKALQLHENRHHDIQLGCVEELRKTLKAAKQLDGATLNQIIADLQESSQKKQDEYDRTSEHGAKEGVVLKLDA